MVGRVSGPRRLTFVTPGSWLTTTSSRPSATDTNWPPPLLRLRHTRSMYGESDGLPSKVINMLAAPHVTPCIENARMRAPGASLTTVTRHTGHLDLIREFVDSRTGYC